MHFEFLVEELSAEAALKNLLPKILGGNHSCEIHAHQGKQDLIKKLPQKLKAYSRWIPEDYRIVVLVDRDNQDCRQLKHDLEKKAEQSKLATKTTTRDANQVRVVNRIAIEELEAWFFGDVDALRKTYPKVSSSLGEKSKYRDPDDIGGTWEALWKVLRNYYPGGLPKIEVAKKVSSHMDPARNRSKSFQVFRDALIQLVTG